MRLPFELDPQIIHHIIYSQAGSIGKAIIELVMNSVDAGATAVALDISSDGFSCHDDGEGFASRDDVLRYFGRFGTPHQDGDATYGRFRLGRGQIMAHARTLWRSRRWQMAVDTREMGYHYELEEPGDDQAGCAISGEWYEPLTSQERMSCIQEIRDLIRYTPVIVRLNGSVISRQPGLETWDAEDDCAWYRLRDEGAVSIYNQGVLVRNDPGSQWGVGGLIVSKQPLALNVSRTEILRKTCPVWQQIARKFNAMVTAYSFSRGNHRKTESRREKSARALLAGEGNMSSLLHSEEVITLLPGKRHVTLDSFISQCAYRPTTSPDNCFTIAPSGSDVPRGEQLARAKVAIVVHPVTLTRFGCYNEHEFMESLERIRANYVAWLEQDKRRGRGWDALTLIDFRTLSDAFVDATLVVSEKTLDAETRRAWTALRWCLTEYAAMCSGGSEYYNGRVNGGIRFSILLGESTTADAWTDGQTYIAYNIDIVRRLKQDALCHAGLLFSLTEHEVAHEGDSLDCGHDEAFYQRFHEISSFMAPARQRYMHIWLRKYTTSLEGAGKRAAGTVWRERWLEEKASTGRQNKGLPGLISSDGMAEAVSAPAEPEDKARLSFLNLALRDATAGPSVMPDWPSVIVDGIQKALTGREDYLRDRQLMEKWYAANGVADEEDAADELMWLESRKMHYLSILPGATEENLTDQAIGFLTYETSTREEELEAWGIRAWDNMALWNARNSPSQDEAEYLYEPDFEQSTEKSIPDDWLPFLHEGETRWMISRNAAAAGFMREVDYLRWRQGNEA